MGETESRLLVIVVVYNGMRWLERCLRSVTEASIPADLFIVDNGSTDGSIEFVKSNFPDAEFIISTENLGFGKANNLGLQYALNNDYDYVYLLNQDAWVHPSTFEKLIQISSNNKQFGILSPLQTNAEETKLDKLFDFFLPHEMMLSDALCRCLHNVYPVEFVQAAHWLLPRKTLKVVGGFSPTFPHYGEDDNFVHRTHYHGLKVGIVPSAKAVHDREYRTLTIKQRQHQNLMAMLVYLSYPQRNTGIFTPIKVLLIVMLRKNKLTFHQMVKLFRDYRSIIYNKKHSLKQGAFLDQNGF